MAGPLDRYYQYKVWIAKMNLDGDNLTRILAQVESINPDQLSLKVKQETDHIRKCVLILRLHISRIKTDIIFFSQNVSARIKKTYAIEQPPDELLIQRQLKKRFLSIRKNVKVMEVMMLKIKKLVD